MQKQPLLSDDQVKTAYKIFSEVTGGLHTGWIHSASLVPEEQLYTMMGVPVEVEGYGRCWSAVWVNIRDMSDEQNKKWQTHMQEMDADLIEDYLTPEIFKIGFKAKEKHADQLQGLSSEVEPD